MVHHDRKRNGSARARHMVPDDADEGMRQLTHQLASQSLYIKDIPGDGNCLFRSLADQLGDTSIAHAQIRHEVVTYLRRNADAYAAFVEEDLDIYLDRMARDGVYGDNLEIVGFANAYKRPVKIYQPDLAYVVTPDTPTQAEMLHIAYHSWEHYSSIRNRDGPHEGPPEIKAQAVALPPLQTRSADAPASDLEKICLASVPGVELAKVRAVMAACYGRVNEAVEKLLEEQVEADVREALGEESTAVETHVVATPAAQEAVVEEQVKRVKEMPVKRVSARERKEQAKRAQKQAALDRKRQNKQGKASAPSATAVEQGIKTMFV